AIRRADGCIHHHAISVRASTVTAEPPIAATVRIKRPDRSTDHARFEQSQIDWISAVHCQVFDLFRLDCAPDSGGLGFYEHARGADFNAVRHGAHRQIDVDAELGCRTEFNLALFIPLEARILYLQTVRAHKQIRNYIVAIVVREYPVLLTVALIRHGDAGSEYYSLGWITNETGDLTGVELCQGDRRRHTQ